MGRRGPKPLSAGELARRGSWRARARRERGQREAALRVVADKPSVDDRALRALTQRILDTVNAADLPADRGERVELIVAAGEWLVRLARDPLAAGEANDDDADDRRKPRTGRERPPAAAYGGVVGDCRWLKW